MTMTDPIADMLSRVRNANHAQHDTVSMPASKIKANIAGILKQEGYISDYSVEGEKAKKTLSLDLKYNGRERSVWPASRFEARFACLRKGYGAP